VHWTSSTRKEEIEVFKHLAGLCVPENLTCLSDLKFELHNTYLAADWEKARQLFSRLAVLGLLDPPQMHALRGQFWFLSAFGRQIEYEMGEEGFLCDWVRSLPDWRSPSIEFERFTRPEQIQNRSPQHWVLVAWCVNPRSPQPIPGPEFATIADDGLLVNPLDTHDAAQLTTDDLRLFYHERYRDFVPVQFPTFSEGLKKRLSMSVQDLCEASTLDERLGALYPPLLARAEFALGRFNEAGSKYEQTLANKLVFEGSDGTKEDYEWELAFSAAWSYRQGGDYARAINTMRKFAEARHPGSAWWVAKWYSECGKYEEAALELKRECENTFSPPDSWLLSSVLAIAAVAKDEQTRAETFVERLMRGSPEVVGLIRSLLTEQCPQFAKLQRSCQDRWLHAVCETYVKPVVQEAQIQNYRDAVLGYGWIVERELKTEVFDRFRKRVMGDDGLRTQSEKQHKVEKKDILLSFIHAEEYGLTLGQMIGVLERASTARNETEKVFSHRLGKRFPNLHSCIPHMKKLNEEWRRAKHESPVYQRSDVLEVAVLCRQSLRWM
jgi:tetratricopeptide (TPR) repeat protein